MPTRRALKVVEKDCTLQNKELGETAKGAVRANITSGPVVWAPGQSEAGPPRIALMAMKIIKSQDVDPSSSELQRYLGQPQKVRGIQVVAGQEEKGRTQRFTRD